MIDFSQITSPAYIMKEDLLRKNLSLIHSVSQKTGVNIILAFKAFALWKSFPIIREYIQQSTASSVFEAKLAFEEMKERAHAFSPAYSQENFADFLKYCSHITFNSLSQFHHLSSFKSADKVSFGLRINPEFSVVKTDLYNPTAPGSRFGVTVDVISKHGLPQGIEGLHFHTLCESSSFDLEKTLEVVDHKFGSFLKNVKWLNMGGGHLMTREGYDVNHLIRTLNGFQAVYPHLQLIMEPGSAFAWDTGVLVSHVVDIVENAGVQTAILDVSFTCHMPDCLEMPYKPRIRGAYQEPIETKPTYRMGGCSCLSGDFIGEWSFDEPLKIGDKVIFEDMMHYTTVKTTMFNGVNHPDIILWSKENKPITYKRFTYDDYKHRMC